MNNQLISHLCGEFSYVELYKFLGYSSGDAHVIVKYPCYFEFKKSQLRQIKLKPCRITEISSTFNIARKNLLGGICIAENVINEYASGLNFVDGNGFNFVGKKGNNGTFIGGSLLKNDRIGMINGVDCSGYEKCSDMASVQKNENPRFSNLTRIEGT